MNVLVTGSTGYIGSNLVRHLTGSGRHQVFCTYRDPAKRTELERLLGPAAERATWVRSDLERLTCLPTGIDAVVHAAARRGIGLCERDSAAAVRDNVEGTRRVVEAARQARVRRFVYLSSQSVYGEGTPCPWTEESGVRPLNVYALTKYAGELASASLRESGVATFILRPARVYGAGSFMVEEGVMAAFARAVAADLPLTVLGSGRQRVSLVHIDDLCGLIAHLLEVELEVEPEREPERERERERARDGDVNRGNSGGFARVYNVCSGSGITVDQLADAFISAAARLGLPRPSKRHVDPPGGPAGAAAEPRDYWLDGSKAQAELGWRPRLALDAGLTGLLSAHVDRAARHGG